MSEEQDALERAKAMYNNPEGTWITDLHILSYDALIRVRDSLDEMCVEINFLRRAMAGTVMFSRDVGRVMRDLAELKRQAYLEVKRRQDVFKS